MAQLINCGENMADTILTRDDATAPPSPDEIAVQYDTLKLVAIIKKTTQQDALWSACLLELTARCQDLAVAQVVVDEQVRIRSYSRR